MSAILLERTEEPTEKVCLEQPRVHVKWENQDFGFGTLYITERNLVWISDENESGFTLTYPSIGVYGISSTDHENPEPGMVMVVDLNKTGIQLAPRANGQSATHNIEEDEDLDEDGSRSAKVRLTPEDSNSLNLITGLMQQCHLLNPDEEDELESSQNITFEDDDIIDHSGPTEADESWFTPETPDNEIRLSAEGRANLERIVGNLHLAADEMRDGNLIGVLFLFIQISNAQIVSQSVAKIGPRYVSTYGKRTGEGSAALSFLQLVRQKSDGSQVPQCPCVHLPGSDKCVAYDSRYQAVSIEEAMLTFVDQSMDPRIYEQRTGSVITPASFACSSTECRQCVAMLSVRLRQIGLLRRALNFPFPVPSADQIIPTACPRLRLSRGIRTVTPDEFSSWATTAITNAAGLREEFSRRPRSIFARLVEQAVNEGRAAAGLPLISGVLRSVGSHSANIQTNKNNQNAGSQRQRNSNSGGRTPVTGGANRGSNAAGSRSNARSNAQSGTNAGSGRVSLGNNGGIRNNGRSRSGVQNGGRIVSASRPRSNSNSNTGKLTKSSKRLYSTLALIPPRSRPNAPFRQGSSFNQNGRDRFQQIVNGNQGPPQVIIPSQFPQQPQFPQQQQFQPQQPQFPQQQQFQTQQPQFQTQPQESWNNNGQNQWSQSGTFNGQQPLWNGQQPQSFGIQPQTIMNAVGQASQFIPNVNNFGGSTNVGGNNGVSTGNNGIGFGVDGNSNGWNGIGGAGGGNNQNGQGSAVIAGPGLAAGIPTPPAIGFRKTRQATTKENTIGERFVVNCVERGDAETESSDFLNLCTVCWTWRQLPDNYFPRLINELVCQESDFCLSGWGTCMQRYRNMDVLQKVGNDWRPTSISVASCCDCKVKAGSEAHGLTASSSRAAEILQTSGLGIQFLSLGGDPTDADVSLPFDATNQQIDEFDDVEPEIRVAFRKLTKRESNTREKGLKTLAEAVEKADVNSVTTLNGIRHFVQTESRVYELLPMNVFLTVILKFRKQAAEHVIKMLPYTLMTLNDHLATVRKSGMDLLEKCFNEEQRKKVYERAAPKTVAVCLQIIQKKHNSLNKQKFEDIETHAQRMERIVLQAVTTLGKLHMYAEKSDEIVKVLDECYDGVSKVSLQIHGNIVACILQLIKSGNIANVMSSRLLLKIVKLLPSKHPILYRNAFGCYLYMVEAIASRKVESIFTTEQFLHELVVRMVKEKGPHFESLHECLLPLFIIAIKYAENEKPVEWMTNVLESFFEGDVSNDVYLSWCNTFVDVLDWLFKTYLSVHWNEKFASDLYDLCLKFLNVFLERNENLPTETKSTASELVGKFLVRRTIPIGDKKVDAADRYNNELISKLIHTLPFSASFADSLISYCADHREPSVEKMAKVLKAQLMESTQTPDWLFDKMLQGRDYDGNEQLNLKLFADRLIDAFKTSNSDHLLQAYKFLRQREEAEHLKLSDVIDLTSISNIRRLFAICKESGGSELFDVEERLQLLKYYVKSGVNSQNLWSDEFLAWFWSLSSEDTYKLLEEVFESMSFDLFVKLILAVCTHKEYFVYDQRRKLADIVLCKLIESTESVDSDKRFELDRFLRETKPTVDTNKFEQKLKESTRCQVDQWKFTGRRISGLDYVVNKFECSFADFLKLSRNLDCHFVEQILFTETMLGTVALSSKIRTTIEESPSIVLTEMLNTSVFYLSMDSKLQLPRFYVALNVVLCDVYLNGSIVVQDDLCRSIPKFLQLWQEKVSKWNIQEVVTEMFDFVVQSSLNIELPFTILYAFRHLARAYEVNNLSDLITSSALQPTDKIRALSALSNQLPIELLDPHSSGYLPFILSLERASERVKSGQDEENVSLVLLADLHAKIEADEIDWLFSVNGHNPENDALSCAVMRLFVELAHIAHELPPKIRELVLCGLVTITTNFTTTYYSDGPVRLLTLLGLNFFSKYDNTLTKALAVLRSSVTLSDDLLEQRSKLELFLKEWRDFFSPTTAANVTAWIYWLSSNKNVANSQLFPEFFRLQLCKVIYNVDYEVGLFDIVREPTPLLSSYLGDDEETPTTKEVFDDIVGLLFCEKSDLQLTAVHLLQHELVGMLSSQSVLTDEMNRMTLFDGESTSALTDDEQQADEKKQKIENKLCQFFTSLFDRYPNDDMENYYVESIDPLLVIGDLLIRVIRLLDSTSAATVSTTLGDGKMINRIFNRICAYLSFSSPADVIEQNVQRTPDQFFTIWKDQTNYTTAIDSTDSLSQRILTIDGYACWLYRRSLETLPAVVREWFATVKNNPLREYTKKYITPVLIENEMKSVERNYSSGGFSMRSRPQTREIVARYQFEELRLELTILLPEDYPLSQATVQHDQRNVLTHGLTKNLHLNLFAFVNNRNGAIVDGILQWKQNVEKSVEGAEACSICLSVIASTNYRLPRLRCRTCKNRFHDDCMFKWVKSSASCPLCRTHFGFVNN
ncbi:E3 ubiquitin-protein ligase listerin [Aphelenchoides besseyi]|nr:E3 ubiquitin-protein ligase listerin [Aphelenchoides besseyi]